MFGVVAVENRVSQDGVFAQQRVWQRYFGFASQCGGFASEGFGQVSKVLYPDNSWKATAKQFRPLGAR